MLCHELASGLHKGAASETNSFTQQRKTMRAHRNSHFVQLLVSAGMFGMLTIGCQESTGRYLSALTGEECVPDATYLPRDAHTNNGNGNTSPTGIPGDNLDDLRSGKVDCLYDGDSGQGNDDRCFPPGCDEQGCCDDDMFPEDPDGQDPVDQPTDGDPAPDPDGDTGTDPGTDPDGDTSTDPDGDTGTDTGTGTDGGDTGTDTGTDGGDSGDGGSEEPPPPPVL